jgi:EAL domain-containing protein (putative c-di-GMP-specific phosphodiesterase class I)
LVSPGDFIPVAEETGLIVQLGEWVLREACRQAQAWRDAGLPEISMSVNLSARQFRAPDLVQTILGVLAETGLEARFLEMEITESMLMHDPEGAITVLDELQKYDIRFAMDDFGTGYSSLNYLKRFPIHKLKIDQSFVFNITTDPDDAAIANAVIELSHGLNLKVIAEGVETEAQRIFLHANGCDEMQGFLFSRPVSAEEMGVLLAANRQKLAAPGAT